jgi:hypothetical protein
MHSFQKPKLKVTLLSDSKRIYDVYSMVTMDELTIRTPDYLLSGEATERLIERCIPSIGQVAVLPFSDIQKLLICIRIASGMNDIDFLTVCPECKEESTYTIELNKYTDFLSYAEWNTPLILNNACIKFKPISYREYSGIQQADFRLAKQLYQLSTMQNSEECNNIITSLSIQRTQLKRAFYFSCISSTNGVDGKFLREWYEQISPEEYLLIENKITSAIKEGSISALPITCACGHQEILPVDMDFCNIFRNKLIPYDEEKVINELNSLDNDIKNIQKNTLEMIWFMRGAISYEEGMNLSSFERECIEKIIEKNVENTKNSNMPLI